MLAIHNNSINMTNLIEPRPSLTPDADYVKSHIRSKAAVESIWL
jgi:hypothetical protein